MKQCARARFGFLLALFLCLALPPRYTHAAGTYRQEFPPVQYSVSSGEEEESLTFEEEEIPLAPAPVKRSWALSSLVITLTSLVLGFYMLAKTFSPFGKKEPVPPSIFGLGWGLACSVLGIVSFASFIIVSDMRGYMIAADGWTVVLAVMLAMQIAFSALPSIMPANTAENSDDTAG